VKTFTISKSTSFYLRAAPPPRAGARSPKQDRKPKQIIGQRRARDQTRTSKAHKTCHRARRDHYPTPPATSQPSQASRVCPRPPSAQAQRRHRFRFFRLLLLLRRRDHAGGTLIEGTLDRSSKPGRRAVTDITRRRRRLRCRTTHTAGWGASRAARRFRRRRPRRGGRGGGGPQ
jgi:hypothetical protein